MILDQAENLFKKLTKEIRTLTDKSESISSLTGPVLKTVTYYNGVLKEISLSTKFKDPKEEITFFKSVKPKFVSLQIYYQLLQDLESKRPRGNIKVIGKYYQKELKKLEIFYDANSNILHYYRSGAYELDGQLFLRDVETYPGWMLRIRTDVDERFSTAADHLISRIIAMDKLQDYIVKVITTLYTSTNITPTEETAPNLKWTGESINLVEMAYGIWLTGQMNNGNATISEIIRWLETSLGVNVGRAYRRWTEISRRNTITTTKYLDQMREAINVRLMNEDDLKRQKRQSIKNRDI